MAEVVTLPTGAPAPVTLVGAVASVMGEVHTVAKHGINQFHRYHYAKMEDILKEITPLLAKHGLVIFQSETGRAMFDEDNVIAVEYAFTVAHVSGETWPQPLRQTGVSTCRNSKGGWDDKSLNKCHTAARKYFLLALFQIPTGEEADADQGENDSPHVVHKHHAQVSRDADRPLTTWSEEKEISGRRAAVQLNRAFSKPQHVIEPPKRRLDRELDKQRNTGPGFEARIKAEQRQDRRPIPQRFDERNPPPTDDIPEFLDRRR